MDPCPAIELPALPDKPDRGFDEDGKGKRSTHFARWLRASSQPFLILLRSPFQFIVLISPASTERFPRAFVSIARFRNRMEHSAVAESKFLSCFLLGNLDRTDLPRRTQRSRRFFAVPKRLPDSFDCLLSLPAVAGESIRSSAFDVSFH